jgi:hypothetical protein
MIKTPIFLAFLSCIASGLLLTGCEVHYKAHEDARYYTDRTITEYEKTINFARTRFNKDYVPPKPDEMRLHLSNFDTFVCDGARQLIANFDREEKTVALAFDRKNKFLTRQITHMPFTDGIYDLFVMDDGTILVQKDKGTIFQHCRPLVADSIKGEVYKAGGGGVPPVTYEYTPTVTPADYNRGDKRFEREMTK